MCVQVTLDFPFCQFSLSLATFTIYFVYFAHPRLMKYSVNTSVLHQYAASFRIVRVSTLLFNGVSVGDELVVIYGRGSLFIGIRQSHPRN